MTTYFNHKPKREYLYKIIGNDFSTIRGGVMMWLLGLWKLLKGKGIEFHDKNIMLRIEHKLL